MSDHDLFWTVFAAVLWGIILGGSFFWGMAAYSRHEKNGTAGTWDSHTPAIAILLPLLFGLGAFYLAMGGT
jgi:hypothetical protein